MQVFWSRSRSILCHRCNLGLPVMVRRGERTIGEVASSSSTSSGAFSFYARELVELCVPVSNHHRFRHHGGFPCRVPWHPINHHCTWYVSIVHPLLNLAFRSRCWFPLVPLWVCSFALIMGWFTVVVDTVRSVFKACNCARKAAPRRDSSYILPRLECAAVSAGRHVN